MKKVWDYTTVYADDEFVVLNKRSGLLVARDRYDENAPRLDLIAEKEFGKLFAVHRIDKDTSGLILYARTEQSHKHFSLQFENREVQKIYHCITLGKPSWKTLLIDEPLLADGDSRHRTTVNHSHGKPSVTVCRVMAVCGKYTWIEAQPRTGRTHQIRVHLAQHGQPIVCDALYNRNLHPIYVSELKRRYSGDASAENPIVSRLALHALSLTVTHPVTNERLSFTAPYPKDMEAARNQMQKIFNVEVK